MTSFHIPEKCGVILLPDTVLFPRGTLPLHIFEPRYRKMLKDSLSESYLFCIGNLQGDEAYGYDKAVQKIGTLGLIRASRETKEGTSNLVLQGITRVQFNQWHDQKTYPFATIQTVLDTTLTTEEEEDYTSRLRSAVDLALLSFPTELQTSVNHVLNQIDNPSALADTVAQQFINDPTDRQTLLETLEVRKRLDFLTRFLENAV